MDIHHYSVPIPENINVGVDAPERDFYQKTCPGVHHLRGEEIIEMYDKKKKALAEMQRK